MLLLMKMLMAVSGFILNLFVVLKSLVNGKKSGYQNTATRQILMLEDGQEFCYSSFTATGAIAGVFQVYTPLYPTADKREFSQPGSLGISLFTYKVDDIYAFRDRLLNSNADKVSAVITNEFGEPSISFIAPDGMYWVMIG